ncbi:MAG: phosphopantothenoylcysteine decarboxylase [Spirochaetes bacterium]|nr:phosphopantothenoylcysteine decarboxylase [Spirochaetota bacterium]
MKKILLGVTSSVSIYKSCELVRLFKKSGNDVRIVMSDNAVKLISPLLFETLSENPVHVTQFTGRTSMEHITLKQFADIFVVAPATADVISKFASGIADSLITTVYLSMKCPVLIAPAMNPDMWTHPSVIRNVDTLKNDGVSFTGPDCGDAACGDTGYGRLAPVEKIYEDALSLIR